MTPQEKPKPSIEDFGTVEAETLKEKEYKNDYHRMIRVNRDNQEKAEEDMAGSRVQIRALQEQLDRLNRLRLEGLDSLSFDSSLSDETLNIIGKNWVSKKITEMNHDETYAWMKVIQGAHEQIHFLVTQGQIRRENKEKSTTILITDIRQRELEKEAKEKKKEEKREKMNPENRAREKAINGIMTAMKCSREKAESMLGGLS